MLQIRKFKKTCIYNITYAKNNLFSDIMEPVTKFIRETGIQYILDFVGPNFHFHIIPTGYFLYCYIDQNMSCSLGKLIPTAYKNLVYCFKPRRHWISIAQSAGRHSHE